MEDETCLQPRDQHLLLFTKYPVPNFAKTRLIPSLGPQGAAEFSQQLTEHTLKTIHKFCSINTNVSTRVHYAAPAGTSSASISSWITPSDRLAILPQSSGDLGARLYSAFSKSFNDGARAVVVIGSDAPGLTADILSSSFEALTANDIVIGPAADGGYYLLGMRTIHTSLFENIPWSTSDVFTTTLKAAASQSLTVAELPVLRDVDTPEDLGYARILLGAR